MGLAADLAGTTVMLADHDEPRQLADADQADRTSSGGTVPDREAWPATAERDRARRRRVAELIEAGALTTGADYFHAALVSSMARRSRTTSAPTN